LNISDETLRGSKARRREASRRARREPAGAASSLAVITVEGLDRPGIIAAVASEVAARGANNQANSAQDHAHR
jgi:hypothetical protein